jgi:NADH-quinone oxidoreductase subunit M
MLRKVTHGPAGPAVSPAIAGAEWFAWAPLVALALAVGLAPTLVLAATSLPVEALIR